MNRNVSDSKAYDGFCVAVGQNRKLTFSGKSIFNVLPQAWIYFGIHNWFIHLFSFFQVGFTGNPTGTESLRCSLRSALGFSNYREKRKKAGMERNPLYYQPNSSFCQPSRKLWSDNGPTEQSQICLRWKGLYIAS